MVTIVEAQQHIASLWSRQEAKSGELFRLMKYVIVVNRSDIVLMHNVVTGQLVVLDQQEAEVIENQTFYYSPIMDKLIVPAC